MATIDAPAEIYRTSTILAGMANLPRASVFLRDKLFSKVVTTPTDQVDISFYKGKAKLTPYCSRYSAGIASPRERTLMRLRHNVITQGRYYKAGEDIPNDLLSDAMRKYAVSADEIQQQRRDADEVESKPAPSKLSSRNYVKRDNAFKRSDSVETIPGEPLYKRDVNANSPRCVRYGKVQA